MSNIFPDIWLKQMKVEREGDLKELKLEGDYYLKTKNEGCLRVINFNLICQEFSNWIELQHNLEKSVTT